MFVLLLGVAGVGQSLAQTFTLGNLTYRVNEDLTSVSLYEGPVAYQGYSCPNFYYGIPVDWAVIDADGDGYGFETSAGMAVSASYLSEVGALSPDNYLVSSQMDFTGATIIKFKARPRDTFSYVAEHFGVAVSLGSQTDATDFEMVAEWTFSATDWHDFSVDLSQYAGQSGYVAIRHFGCTDQYELQIQYVSIGNENENGVELSIPESIMYENSSYVVTRIEARAFNQKYFIMGNLVIPNNITSIGDSAFWGCSNLNGELTLSESLLSVGNYAFAGCDEITTINYNATNCAEMGNAQSPVFYDCASIAHINIGVNVQSIPNYAFKRCSTIVDMTVAAVVPPTIGPSTFSTISRSTPVHVPYGSGDAYRNAPYWEEFFNITEDYSPSQYSCHWTVDTHQFADNMTAIGVIQIDGEEQTTDALEIGAFCGDECRGRQLLAYYPDFDRYLLFLTIYGEDGDALSFRLYDHEAGTEIDKGCSTHLTFLTNDIIGTLAEPHPFNFVAMQDVQFASGWNWWSGYVELGDDGLSLMQEGLDTHGLMIKSQNDGYASYLDGFGWYGSLASINNENTYQIRVSEACAVGIEGTTAQPADHPIILNPGWTWVGYPVGVSMGVGDALAGITPQNGDMLKSQNEGFVSFLEGFGWYGSLSILNPGMGLMYKSNNDNEITFVYPNNATRANLKANQTTEGNHWQPNLNAYADNMSVMAVVELDGMELQGENFELAAFANGECRGSARLMYVEPLNRYMAFLTIAGDEATELNFGLYNTETGTVVETVCTPSLQYETNAVVGSFEAPYVVSFRSTTGVDEWSSSLQVFPNPVEHGQTISLDISAVETLRATSVQIINALGMVVETLRATSMQRITAPETVGVYTLRVTIEGKGTSYRKLIVR